MKRKCKISILFWQRKGRGTAEMSPVFCRITIAGQRYEITTNVTISHKNWSSKLQRSIGKTQEDREANRNLESVYDNVTETIERIQKKGYELNIPNFKLMYTNGQGEVKTLRSLFEYHKTMEGKKLSASTNRAYEITLSHLLNFIRITHKAHDYDITLVDKIFVNEFAAYLQGYRREDDKKRCEVNGALKHLKRLKKLMKQVFSYASLTCIQQSVMNFGILMVQGLVNSFGTAVMAAFTAAVKIDSFAYMPVQDFGNAFSTFTAQNYGAGKNARILKGIKSAFGITTLFCLLLSLTIFLFASQLMQIFISPEETEIIRIGTEYLRIEGSFYLGIGYLFLWYGFYRAVCKPEMSIILTILSLGTRVVLAYALAAIPSIGVHGIWWAIPIGWALADVYGWIYYWRKNKEILH